MISDTLHDAAADISYYLDDFPEVYPPGPLRERIVACVAEMRDIQRTLDDPPAKGGGR